MLNAEAEARDEGEVGMQLRPKILVVDDEIHILKAVKRLFYDDHFTIFTALSGEEALEYLASEDIAVIISDQRMPGMSGAELLHQCRKMVPNTVRIMLTGNGDLSTAKEAINDGEVFRFVTKPWEHGEFLALIRLAVEHYSLLEAKERYEAQIRAQNLELRELNEELEHRVQERTREVVAKQEEVARLYDELQESFGATIKVLTNILELGDPQVVEHSQRTAERVRNFCKQEQWSEELSRDVERAALLHWTGLINAPGEIFSKREEELDAEEQAAWEFHPLLGQQAISQIRELHRAGEMIANYTRRYDDPYFSEEHYEEDLILGSQILGITSCFERFRTRARREGRLHSPEVFHEGLAYLLEQSGELFDPGLVMAFQRMVALELEQSMSDEQSLRFRDLKPGMVLSRPLETTSGTAVAPRDMMVTRELLQRWTSMEEAVGFGPIFVWRRSSS